MVSKSMVVNALRAVKGKEAISSKEMNIRYFNGLDRSVVLRLAVYKYLRNNAPELLEEVDEKVDRSVEVIGDEA